MLFIEHPCGRVFFVSFMLEISLYFASQCLLWEFLPDIFLYILYIFKYIFSIFLYVENTYKYVYICVENTYMCMYKNPYLLRIMPLWNLKNVALTTN